MPTADLIINGSFSQVEPGTTSTQSDDKGDPSGWIVNEPDSEEQVQVYSSSNRLAFSRSNSNTGASISQDITGVKADGSDITFSFHYSEVGKVKTGLAVQATITDKDGTIILQETVTDPGTHTYSFPANSKEYTVTFLDVSSTGDGRDAIIDDVTFVAPICFVRGTMIDTPQGPRRVENLQIGDQVLTMDRGAQPLRWRGRRRVNAKELQQFADLRPVRICQGALGADIPAQTLMVSPQHRVMLQSRLTRRMFGAQYVLSAAKHLLAYPGIGIAEDMAEVEYFHLLFDHHEIIRANGALVESLRIGPQAWQSLNAAQRSEIEHLFPQIESQMSEASSGHMIAKGAKCRSLVSRSSKNGKPLFEALAG